MTRRERLIDALHELRRLDANRYRAIRDSPERLRLEREVEHHRQLIRQLGEHLDDHPDA